MIALADVITRFEADYLRQYPHALTSQRQALAVMKHCRTSLAPRMLAMLNINKWGNPLTRAVRLV